MPCNMGRTWNGSTSLHRGWGGSSYAVELVCQHWHSYLKDRCSCNVEVLKLHSSESYMVRPCKSLILLYVCIPIYGHRLFASWNEISGINTFSPRENNSALPSEICIGSSDESPNSRPPTNYYSIKPYSNPSGPTVYSSRALFPPPTLKFWNDSNLRSCALLWTPHGTFLIHSSEGISTALQSKKKSAVTALTMVIDFAPIPIISQ
jgi:hypothetical protein